MLKEFRFWWKHRLADNTPAMVAAGLMAVSSIIGWIFSVIFLLDRGAVLAALCLTFCVPALVIFVCFLMDTKGRDRG